MPVWDQMLYGGNLVVRRSALERVGPLRPDMSPGEEEDWERRLLAAGGHILYLPEAWVWHRRTQEDLGWRHLVRRSYRAGYSHVPYLVSVGDASTPARQLVMVIRGVGHTVVFGCFYGMLRASRAWGIRRGLLAARRSAGS
jgi:GT2 family glycosyltransferase